MVILNCPDHSEIPEVNRTKACNRAPFMSEWDSVQQSAIVEVAVRTERSMKGKYCSDHLKKVKKAKTRVVVSTTKLECSIYKCIQQTADAEVVGPMNQLMTVWKVMQMDKLLIKIMNLITACLSR